MTDSAPAAMTPEQRQLARHALGLTPGRPVSYRNRFVADPSHPDFDDWSAMVAAGWARVFIARYLVGDLFLLTRAGAELALEPGEALDPEDFPDEAVTA